MELCVLGASLKWCLYLAASTAECSVAGIPEVPCFEWTCTLVPISLLSVCGIRYAVCSAPIPLKNFRQVDTLTSTFDWNGNAGTDNVLGRPATLNMCLVRTRLRNPYL